MKKTGVILALILLAAILTFSPARAADKVYVNNNQVHKVLPYRGQIYVDITEFLKKGNYSWQLKENTLIISDGSGKRPFIQKVPSSYSYKGKTFKAFTFARGQEKFVMVKSLANNLGLRYRYTKSSRSHDFYKAGVKLPSREVTEEPTKEKGEETGEATEEEPKAEPEMVTYKGDEIKKSVIKPKNDFMYDYTSGELRGTVYYTNNANVKITKISVVFKIVDSRGTLWSKKHSVGTLEPGAKSKEFTYWWIPPYRIDLVADNFQYEISYLQPPELKEKEGEK